MQSNNGLMFCCRTKMEDIISCTLVLVGTIILFTTEISEGFTIIHHVSSPLHQRIVVIYKVQLKMPTRKQSRLFIIAPPGSGYFRPEDEVSELPDSYEPMMEYPGTMRPGRTPDNSPFHNLPIGDDDPEPVPWPHFQQIEWHHRWEPPHPHPLPMEEFIEQQGRWATPEQEAEMRSTTRKASRKRREIEEEKRREEQPLIMDDEEDDDDDADIFPQDLGEGIFGKLGSTDDEKITAAATSPDVKKKDRYEDEEDTFDDEGSLDDFLLDLGLDSLDDEEEGEDEFDEFDNEPAAPVAATLLKSPATQGLEDVVITSDANEEIIIEDDNANLEVSASIDVDEDDNLDLGLDDEDELDDSMEVPLEDVGDSDNLEVDDFFDDGGFDYDDGDFGDGDFDSGY
jgi:hypothetical protein